MRRIVTAMVIAGLFACGDGPTEPPPPEKKPRPTLTLSASSTNVVRGESLTLTWTSQHATSCTASGDWSGSKAMSGSEDVTPDSSATYTLTCSGDGGSVERVVSVTVEEPAIRPLIVHLAVSPDSGSIPLTVDITIAVDSADSDAIRYGIDCTNDGTLEIDETVSAPGYTKDAACTYEADAVLIVHAWQDQRHGEATQYIQAVPPPPAPVFESFEATPDTTHGNESSELRWRVQHTLSCTASGDWSGSRKPAGVETVQPLDGDKTYILTCFAVGDSAITTSDTLTVHWKEAYPNAFSANIGQRYGFGSLRGVDVVALSGSDYGSPVRYEFDCDGDGINELDVTEAQHEYIAWELCDYTSVGDYTARITITAPALAYTFDIPITIYPAQLSQARQTSDRADEEATPEQIHVIYMIPSDGVDRRFDEHGVLTHSLDAMQQWMRDQTGGGDFIFDTDAGTYDITFLRMKHTRIDIAHAPQNLLSEAVLETLQNNGFNSQTSPKRYLIFLDALTRQPGVCGYGASPIALVLLGDMTCNTPPLSAHPNTLSWTDLVSAHELLHVAGLVDQAAPHYGGGGHVNDSRDDIMYYQGSTFAVLDYGHDDYFGENVPAGVTRLEDAPFFRNP